MWPWEAAEESIGFYSSRPDGSSLERILSYEEMKDLLGVSFDAGRALYHGQSDSQHSVLLLYEERRQTSGGNFTVSGEIFCLVQERLMAATCFPRADRGLSPSPDGRMVVFQDERQNLYIANADGTQERRIVSGFAFSPVWSPDGQMIYYSLPDQGLWIIKRDGSDPTPVGPPEMVNRKVSLPDYSLDSYDPHLNGLSLSPSQDQVALWWEDMLFITQSSDPTLAEARFLGQFSGRVSVVEWSDDESRVLISVSAIGSSSSFELMWVDTEADGVQPLFRHQFVEPYAFCSLSPDKELMVFAGEGKLLTMDMRGEVVKEFFGPGAVPSCPKWSPTRS